MATIQLTEDVNDILNEVTSQFPELKKGDFANKAIIMGIQPLIKQQQYNEPDEKIYTFVYKHSSGCYDSYSVRAKSTKEAKSKVQATCPNAINNNIHIEVSK